MLCFSAARVAPGHHVIGIVLAQRRGDQHDVAPSATVQFGNGDFSEGYVVEIAIGVMIGPDGATMGGEGELPLHEVLGARDPRAEPD